MNESLKTTLNTAAALPFWIAFGLGGPITYNGLSLWFRRGLSLAFHRVVYAAARPVEPAARRNPLLLQRDLMQRDKHPPTLS
jgi:hypothetical protein